MIYRDDHFVVTAETQDGVSNAERLLIVPEKEREILMSTMYAIRVHAYGDANQLHLEQVAQPEPQQGEVLVRVYAAGVNAIDWKVRSGMAKDIMPTTFPYVPGLDFAGLVERVGAGVTTFQPGQAVFGQGSGGTYAEYGIASAETLALKPTSLNFEEAATVPTGATAAWQGLFDHGHLQAGQRVLILGGSGGVGIFAVQFAHSKGAHVITTTSTSNIEFVQALGADRVIDYTRTHVEDEVRDVDLVFDTVGGPATASALPTLKRGGKLITIAGQPDEGQAQRLGVSAEFFSEQISTNLLQMFARSIDAGELRPSSPTIFPLIEANKAQELSQAGHGRGRIVLHVR